MIEDMVIFAQAKPISLTNEFDLRSQAEARAGIQVLVVLYATQTPGAKWNDAFYASEAWNGPNRDNYGQVIDAAKERGYALPHEFDPVLVTVKKSGQSSPFDFSTLEEALIKGFLMQRLDPA